MAVKRMTLAGALGGMVAGMMGIYEPPWEYDPETLATDLSYHLVYGLGVAGAYERLERRQ